MRGFGLYSISALYVTVVVTTFRRYSTYRVATLAGLFTNCAFGFVFAYTYIALWDEKPHLGGYEMSEALTFVWVGQSIIAVAALLGGGFQDDLVERVRDGDIAVDLFRPVDLQLWWLAVDVGRAAFQLMARGVVPLLFGSLVFPLALPTSPVTWTLFLLSTWLGVTVSFGIRYLLALASFWLLDGAGVNLLGMLLSVLLSGLVLPLHVFPGQLASVVGWLPWAATFQLPADVLLERYQGAGLAGLFTLQLLWALALLGVGRLVQSLAARKVVVQGG
ncbi:ABC-2 family transporter protein [Streptomyces sp. NPDC005438]|uniref:ABC transporter permease n=1 Tax=Streptomyces sp. NPDC005438 TaxID=3156880 RepID=UPI0033B1DB35